MLLSFMLLSIIPLAGFFSFVVVAVLTYYSAAAASDAYSREQLFFWKFLASGVPHWSLILVRVRWVPVVIQRMWKLCHPSEVSGMFVSVAVSFKEKVSASLRASVAT